MSENPNESDLLAYVEDALDPEVTAALHARLASDHELREKLDSLRRDRTLLRALGEPELPVDFIASLESNLARPLLIQGQPPMGQPGVYRRRHRAASRRTRVGQYAIAAIVLLALGAGIWITSNLRPSIAPSPDADRTVAVAPDGDPRDTSLLPGGEVAGVPENALADGDDAIDPGAEVHHWGPLPPTAAAMAAPAAPAAPDTRAGARAADDRRPLLTAPLVLVLRGEDLDAAEALLQRAVADLTTEPGRVATALVRNFSMAEARRLEERYFPAAGGDREPLAVAEIGAENVRDQRRRYARMLNSLRNRPGDAEDEPMLESRLLYGDEGLASYEKQLELSGRGATHTIAVPAEAFGALLRGLHRLDGPAATLRSFEESSATGATGATGAIDDWIAERRAIDAFMETLRDPGASGSMLLVPVVIE